MAADKSLIDVLNICDNFRPHLSPEHLVPFLLSQDTRPALGLLRPPVVAALRADNAWRAAHGHPLAWEIPDPAPADTLSPSNEGDVSPPYIAFTPALECRYCSRPTRTIGTAAGALEITELKASRVLPA